MGSGDPTSSASRRRLAGQLWRLADFVQASDTRKSFRSRAFRTAVWALDDLSLEDSSESMAAVAGIGPGIIRLIEEFRETGSLGELERLAETYPLQVARMSRLPRMTPRRLRQLKELGVDTVPDLLGAIEAGAAETIDGVGGATVDRWAAIVSLPPTAGAVPAHSGAVTSTALAFHLRRHLPGTTVHVAGESRRLEEWVTQLELVVVADDITPVLRFVDSTAVAASSNVDGAVAELVTHGGLPVRVHMGGERRAGSVLVQATGPPGHIDGLGLDTVTDHPDEQSVYRGAGHIWVPPPARSMAPSIADLIKTDEVVGDLHLHTEWSPDGRMTIDGLVAAAIERGYEYLAITDHTIGLRFGGLDPVALRRQRQDIESARRRHPDLTVLHGAEINIDRHGVPDLDDETLGWLDFVVAGAHSHFDLDADEQTARLVAAVRHPSVKVLAHPTGRRIGIRPGFRVDFGPVFEAAAETATALEVNGHRDRMDLSAQWAATAVAAGVMLAANSDAHRYTELDNVDVAVGIIQRAGVGPDRVVNALPMAEFAAWSGRPV
ncbi:MAG TPA: PHP domain-containing protein [Acidimicrobiia bacterium]|nr:PHP domain-containing protein [Acidimicrobiia bacterium]